MAEPYRTWSSDTVDEADEFSFWQFAASEVYGPMSVDRDEGGRFRSHIVQTTIGPLTLSAIRAGKHRSHRTASMAARHGDGIVHFSIPWGGYLSARQPSRELRLRSGWLGMLWGSEPVTVVADGDFRQLVVGMPAELVVPRLAAGAGVAITSGSLCGLVASTAGYLFAHSPEFSAADAQLATAHFADLIVSSFGSADGSTPQQLILQAAMDEAERRLADRTLNAAALAEGVHVSRRTLEKLFAERGTTVARWLLERRLQRSCAALLTTSASDASVEVIAQRCGFADRTHFSRVFSARFGTSPSQFRRAVQLSGPA